MPRLKASRADGRESLTNRYVITFHLSAKYAYESSGDFDVIWKDSF